MVAVILRTSLLITLLTLSVICCVLVLYSKYLFPGIPSVIVFGFHFCSGFTSVINRGLPVTFGRLFLKLLFLFNISFTLVSVTLGNCPFTTGAYCIAGLLAFSATTVAFSKPCQYFSPYPGTLNASPIQLLKCVRTFLNDFPAFSRAFNVLRPTAVLLAKLANLLPNFNALNP